MPHSRCRCSSPRISYRNKPERLDNPRSPCTPLARDNRSWRGRLGPGRTHSGPDYSRTRRTCTRLPCRTPRHRNQRGHSIRHTYRRSISPSLRNPCSRCPLPPPYRRLPRRYRSHPLSPRCQPQHCHRSQHLRRYRLRPTRRQCRRKPVPRRNRRCRPMTSHAGYRRLKRAGMS